MEPLDRKKTIKITRETTKFFIENLKGQPVTPKECISILNTIKYKLVKTLLRENLEHKSDLLEILAETSARDFKNVRRAWNELNKFVENNAYDS